MIYGKLPVVFLSVLTSEKKDSTNHQIATYILEHIDEMQNIGIQDLAKRCHVAMSSISRFCKEICLKDFAQLKELLADPNFYFEEQSQSDSLCQKRKTVKLISYDELNKNDKWNSYNKIPMFCFVMEKIHAHPYT